MILCEPTFFGETRSCGSVGEPGSHLAELVKGRHTVWFNVSLTDKSRFLVTTEEVPQKILTDTTIIKATPYGFLAPSARPVIDQLVGKRAVMTLGTDGSHSSPLMLENRVFLSCSGLIYRNNNTYLAHCYSEEWGGWGGNIEFIASGESQQSLVNLNTSISEEIEKLDRNTVIFWIVITLVPVLAFLILSLFVFWLSRAYRYVKNG